MHGERDCPCGVCLDILCLMCVSCLSLSCKAYLSGGNVKFLVSWAEVARSAF